ncbi:hypothetical protein K3556_15720 (plasmid) [Aliiroseovarius sp. M344]|uniref:hypothetical protein n=1 Tax=Aliiroseovarius sp. M344 TaxID=2867010 RepID=UPI0021ADF820|nr:hypothetical protein [Aliiroseovarius sp. M344]UWQ16030.1 hypothetical protein K3556_15720 [Aliiroseovarius sp. M344]
MTSLSRDATLYGTGGPASVTRKPRLSTPKGAIVLPVGRPRSFENTPTREYLVATVCACVKEIAQASIAARTGSRNRGAIGTAIEAFVGKVGRVEWKILAAIATFAAVFGLFHHIAKRRGK